MDDLSFLQDAPKGNATVYTTFQDKTHSITNLNVHLISQKAPVLGASFEDGRRGPRLNLDDFSLEAVTCFMRYLYLGDYRLCESLIDEQCSQLIHFQMYHFGKMFDILELRELARIHTIRETELACSTGKAPPQLSESIRYLYDKLCECKDLREILVHYCISCFCCHELDTDFNFRHAALYIFDFRQDLWRANCRQGSSDTGAQSMVQSPSCRPTPHPDAGPEQRALENYLFVLMGESAGLNYTTAKEMLAREFVQMPNTVTLQIRNKPSTEVWDQIPAVGPSSYPDQAPLPSRSLLPQAGATTSANEPSSQQSLNSLLYNFPGVAESLNDLAWFAESKARQDLEKWAADLKRERTTSLLKTFKTKRDDDLLNAQHFRRALGQVGNYNPLDPLSQRPGPSNGPTFPARQDMSREGYKPHGILKTSANSARQQTHQNMHPKYSAQMAPSSLAEQSQAFAGSVMFGDPVFDQGRGKMSENIKFQFELGSNLSNVDAPNASEKAIIDQLLDPKVEPADDDSEEFNNQCSELFHYWNETDIKEVTGTASSSHDQKDRKDVESDSEWTVVNHSNKAGSASPQQGPETDSKPASRDSDMEFEELFTESVPKSTQRPELESSDSEWLML